MLNSHKNNIKIDLTWQDLEDKEDCEELAKDIEAQKEACRQILESKENLIQQFKLALEKKVN